MVGGKGGRTQRVNVATIINLHCTVQLYHKILTTIPSPNQQIYSADYMYGAGLARLERYDSFLREQREPLQQELLGEGRAVELVIDPGTVGFLSVA